MEKTLVTNPMTLLESAIINFTPPDNPYEGQEHYYFEIGKDMQERSIKFTFTSGAWVPEVKELRK